MKDKAYIIGSGIAGIASAIRLAKKGYSVTVFEANAYPGGKLARLDLGQYRFDAGPSLFTLPNLVTELFELCGENPQDHFSFVQLEILCNYFYSDGTRLTAYADRTKLLQEVQHVLKVDPKPLENYLNDSAFVYNKTRKSFLEKSLHEFKTYLSKDILETIFAIPKLHLFDNLNRVNRKKLNHEKLVQLFNRYATYNGSNPYMAPGVLTSIPHLEFNIGAFFPTQGMHSITTSLVELAKRQGVEFKLNEPVTGIIVDRNKMSALKTKNGFYSAKLIISNSDVKQSYNQLLPQLTAPAKTMKQEASSSAMIFYWGINRSFKELDVHNIFFSSNYQNEFETLFAGKTVSDDPTVYVHISSKIVESDAPSDCENWFVMVNVPSNQGQNWEDLRKQIRQAVIRKINHTLQIDIEMCIVQEDYLDPLRIEQRTNSFAGALYGASSNNRLAAFFRQSNKSKIQGLYFVGGSVHPGGGIPLCLLSAKITSELIRNTTVQD